MIPQTVLAVKHGRRHGARVARSERDADGISKDVACQVGDAASGQRQGVLRQQVEVGVGQRHLVHIYNGLYADCCRRGSRRAQGGHGATLHFHALVEEQDDLTRRQHASSTVGRRGAGQQRSLGVFGQDVEVFQVVVRGFRGTLYQHTHDDALLVGGQRQVVVGIHPCVPVGTGGVVAEYRPRLAAIHGVDHTELRAAAGAVADGEVYLHVAETGSRQRHLEELVVLRAVGVVGLSGEMVGGGRVQAQMVVGSRAAGAYLPLAVAGMYRYLALLRHQGTLVGQEVGLQLRPLGVGNGRPAQVVGRIGGGSALFLYVVTGGKHPLGHRRLHGAGMKSAQEQCHQHCPVLHEKT